MPRPARFPESFKTGYPAGTLARLEAVLKPLELPQDAAREALNALIERREKDKPA